MSETKIDDILVPLFEKSDFDEESTYIIRKKANRLYLNGFGVSINFIHLVRKDELNEIITHLKKEFGPPEEKNGEQYLFSWSEITRNDCGKLIEFLEQKYGIDWVKTEQIKKTDDGMTIRISAEDNSLSLRLNNEKTKVRLKIDNIRTDEFIVKTENSKLNIYESPESIDAELFEGGGEFYFNRTIFKSPYRIEKKIKVTEDKEDKESIDVVFRLFVNIAKSQYKKNDKNSKIMPYHIVSVILTSYNHKFGEFTINNKKIIEKCKNEYYNLSNEHIINLVNTDFSSELRFAKEIIIEKKLDKLFKKDIFVAIQLWRDDWENNENNTIDAKNCVKKNPYYFYSILTLDTDVFRRTYENIKDVLGWCQSASGVYFDVFYGNTCLELTRKPKKDENEFRGRFFDETGHDSEEFRIWELLALQNKLLKEINKKKLEGVKDEIDELEKIYNFKIFTKKKGKGEKWIRYGEYLQKITGVDSEYKEFKHEKEIKDKEQESKLQKLNFLILVSIFVSVVTFFLAPIYDKGTYTYLNSTFNATSNTTFNASYKYYISELIFSGTSIPESRAFIFAFGFTLLFSYLYIRKPVCIEEKLDRIKNLMFRKDLMFWIVTVIIVIIALFILYIFFYIYIFLHIYFIKILKLPKPQ